MTHLLNATEIHLILTMSKQYSLRVAYYVKNKFTGFLVSKTGLKYNRKFNFFTMLTVSLKYSMLKLRWHCARE